MPSHHIFSLILQAEIEQVQGLLALLEEEYQLLQNTSLEPLEAITQQKQLQIEKLEASVNQQNVFLQQQELSTDRKGIEALIQQSPADSPIRRQWKEFEQLLETSRKQNEINGSMLTQSRHQVTHTLNLLRGTTQAQKIYGPTGEAQSTETAKLLGNA
ncbi:MAG: flagellar protein FlgN [Gammaproteobacteria bacterium]|nr:flagellar protein FlgN [Gammaproteobacteria bacterium]